jgi:hypothetical protein
MYKIGDIVHVNDKMKNHYSYPIITPMGEDFSDSFMPYHTPKEMLEHGVFEGKYINDCQDEFPTDWFENAKISDKADQSLNYFGIKSRQPLDVWQQKQWIIEPDPRGWFQWYCRYYMGRRLPIVDAKQIKRWKSFARHAGQIKANCPEGWLECRPKQRQALLQWSYNPFI